MASKLDAHSEDECDQLLFPLGIAVVCWLALFLLTAGGLVTRVNPPSVLIVWAALVSREKIPIFDLDFFYSLCTLTADRCWYGSHAINLADSG